MSDRKADAFKAIADPRRRKIIQLLIVSSSLSVQALTANFDMSRQALSRHITTLEESGILKTRKQGRETICYLDLAPIKEVFDVVSQYQAFWEDKLNNLDRLVDQQTT